MRIEVEKIEDFDLMPYVEITIINRWGGLSKFLHRPNQIFTDWDFFAIIAFYTEDTSKKIFGDEKHT
jgi:hypothetical protein